MSVSLKLLLAAVVMSGAIMYVAFLWASSNWQYYVLVDECLDQKGQWCGKRLRVSGRVAVGSLRIAADRCRASFLLEGSRHQLPVTSPGPLPDNLAEARDIVVEGILLDDGQLQGDKVITRCASKYEAK